MCVALDNHIRLQLINIPGSSGMVKLVLVKFLPDTLQRASSQFTRFSSILHGPSSRIQGLLQCKISTRQDRELEPDKRLKRQTTLPAHLQDFEISGPSNWRLSSAAAVQVLDDEQPVSTDHQSPSSWNRGAQPCDEPEELRKQNRDLMQKHDALLAAMEDLKLHNLNLNIKAQQSEYKLEQLRRQSTMETNELCAQIKHLGEVVQQLWARTSPAACSVTHPETAKMFTPPRPTHHSTEDLTDGLVSPHGQHSPHPRQSTLRKESCQSISSAPRLTREASCLLM
ncbi:hypothetical protein GJAV_G00000590 [Gymnothorax javanicus]|nr:hypothetical protein GJAV_G00000590 [Gymnothorax javanicus]